jgi:hypothetical protein
LSPAATRLADALSVLLWLMKRMPMKSSPK